MNFLVFHFVWKLCVLTQSCLTLSSSMNCSPPDSSVHGKDKEWVTISTSGDLPDSGIKPTYFASPILSGDSLPLVPPGKLHIKVMFILYSGLLIVKWHLALENNVHTLNKNTLFLKIAHHCLSLQWVTSFAGRGSCLAQSWWLLGDQGGGCWRLG